jgi:hypothetical protein
MHYINNYTELCKAIADNNYLLGGAATLKTLRNPAQLHQIHFIREHVRAVWVPVSEYAFAEWVLLENLTLISVNGNQLIYQYISKK